MTGVARVAESQQVIVGGMEFRATYGEIQRLDNALAVLDLRERDLWTQLSLIRDERYALQTVRHLATASIAPILGLPNEILAEIFVRGTEG